jgi:hypothetical protein
MKQRPDHFLVLRKEKNIGEECARGCCGRHGVHAIRGALCQQIERLNGRGNIFAELFQFPGERSAACGIAVCLFSNVRDLLLQERGIGGRQPCNGGLACAENTGKQKAFSVSDRARGM